VGSFPALESEMTSWVPGEGDSPNRLDALVWAITELMVDKPGFGVEVW
jgi:phage terminase large subunit-like protein